MKFMAACKAIGLGSAVAVLAVASAVAFAGTQDSPTVEKVSLSVDTELDRNARVVG